jgi:hypothetical protein
VAEAGGERTETAENTLLLDMRQWLLWVTLPGALGMLSAAAVVAWRSYVVRRTRARGVVQFVAVHDDDGGGGLMDAVVMGVGGRVSTPSSDGGSRVHTPPERQTSSRLARHVSKLSSPPPRMSTLSSSPGKVWPSL